MSLEDLLRRQLQHEDGAAQRLVRLLERTRTQLRQRFERARPDSGTAAVLRDLDTSVGEALQETRDAMTGQLRLDVLAAVGLGAEGVDLDLPAALRVGPRFQLAPELLASVNGYHAALVQGLTTETRAQVTEAIQRGILAGATVDAVAREIGLSGLEPLGPFRTAAQRAEAIARTEMNYVMNLAAHERYLDSSTRLVGLGKRWVSTGDDRTRDTHRAAHGQVVSVHGEFTVGGHRARFPLDPKLPAKERVKCRCRMTAVLPENVEEPQPAADGTGGDMRVPEWLLRLRRRPARVTFVSDADKTEAAEAWAKQHIRGLTQVDYSEIDLEIANAVNEVAAQVAALLPLEVKNIAPLAKLGFDPARPSFMVGGPHGLAYNPRFLGPDGKLHAEFALALSRGRAASRTFRDLAAHEMAHVVQVSGRDASGKPLDPRLSNIFTRNIVQEYRKQQGEAAVRAELGDRAWEGQAGQSHEEWKETWAEAFSAYLLRPERISPATRTMVEKVLRKLFPGVDL